MVSTESTLFSGQKLAQYDNALETDDGAHWKMEGALERCSLKTARPQPVAPGEDEERAERGFAPFDKLCSCSPLPTDCTRKQAEACDHLVQEDVNAPIFSACRLDSS